MSSDAAITSRRAMNRGSSPAVNILASQYRAASGSLPLMLFDEGADDVVVLVPAIAKRFEVGGGLGVGQHNPRSRPRGPSGGVIGWSCRGKRHRDLQGGEGLAAVSGRSSGQVPDRFVVPVRPFRVKTAVEQDGSTHPLPAAGAETASTGFGAGR